MRNLNKLILKDLLFSKKLYISVTFIIFGFLMHNIYINNNDIKEMPMPIVYFSIYSIHYYILILIPLFLNLISNNSDYFNSNAIIINYGEIKSWWKDKVKYVLIISIKYSILIHIINGIFMGIVFKNLTYSFEFIRFELVYTLMNIILFNILGLIYLYLDVYINRKSAGYFITLLIPFFDYIAINTRLKFNLLLRHTIEADFIKLNSFNKIITISYLVLLCILLYFLFFHSIKNKDFFIKFALSIVLPIFSFINASNDLKFYNLGNIEDIFIYIYGGFSIRTMIESPMMIFNWITPIIYIVYIIGDYIHENIKYNGPYIFTRTDSREKWFLEEIMKLCKVTFLYIFIHYGILIILGLIQGYTFSNISLGFIAIQYILYTLFVFFIILLSNILNLFFKSILSFLGIVIMTFSFISIISLVTRYYKINKVIFNNLLRLIPVSHSFLSLHDIKFSGNIQRFLFATNYSITFSVIYLVIIIILVILISLYKIKNMDIL